jgi:hypothetical protein
MARTVGLALVAAPLLLVIVSAAAAQDGGAQPAVPDAAPSTAGLAPALGVRDMAAPAATPPACTGSLLPRGGAPAQAGAPPCPSAVPATPGSADSPVH